jgi:hypothetical protein
MIEIDIRTVAVRDLSELPSELAKCQVGRANELEGRPLAPSEAAVVDMADTLKASIDESDWDAVAREEAPATSADRDRASSPLNRTERPTRGQLFVSTMKAPNYLCHEKGTGAGMRTTKPSIQTAGMRLQPRLGTITLRPPC